MRLRSLRWWHLLLGGLLFVGVGVGVGWFLWQDSTRVAVSSAAQSSVTDPVEQAKLEGEHSRACAEAVRTGLVVAGGVGVALALLLAVRRQRAQGIHNNEERVAGLYTAAAEQLGSDKALVRLAGLYALERLAQDNERHRQTIVNVLCAYLRMPYLIDDNQQADHERIPQQVEERLVRQAAQHILTDHLRPERDEKTGQPTNDKFWPDIDLDLFGAALEDWDFSGCEVGAARFTRTHFHGRAVFDEAVFHGYTVFDEAVFHGYTVFGETVFCGDVGFGEAVFHDNVWFGEAEFQGDAGFHEVRVRLDTEAERLWPDGWRVRGPAGDEEGRLEGHEGVWGFLELVEADTQQDTASPAAQDGPAEGRDPVGASED